MIINHAFADANPSRLCAATIELFASILAAEAGNLALKFLATGGVYIAGGVAVHALRAIKEPTFIQRFRRKGRFAELMGRIPIQVVTSPAGGDWRTLPFDILLRLKGEGFLRSPAGFAG